ncbi:VCBS domain-containing protein [Bradyrhizobium sp. CCGUVB23]|uniref:VCBS domain-containing protein n=1 Tax=Bradyrhizobium sp. CCGUVB23 TaxID=2949630 RepID=UPI0020B2519D|nr:VCBS domain-containing protein [Bradyrhizobium sp. CCGUVB23]MCP3465142.1 VCBS domain-containing protein [Bradyrhizobium sp. CCGUVB23]
MTSVVPPPKIIGTVHTAIGCGTLRRASGVATEVMVGDPLCLGDVIETADDGQIGIRFIDDTLFNLSSGARMEVSEFGCDLDGTSGSAHFRISNGTFAFVAGQSAKNGALTVDTPVGSIRGRIHTGGLGMLTLGTLIFSMLKSAEAADANITFLDNDSITYKDVEHGAFELVTKEAIPRHIIVEDPGETVVLNKIGSSVSINQVVNTPARMEELQAAEHDVWANLSKEIEAKGSGTTPFPETLPLEPINFIESDGPAQLHSLPIVLPSTVVVPDNPIILHSPPTFNIQSGPVELDTVVFDTFTATSGTFSASSTSDAPLFFGISGGTAGDTVVGGVTYDVSKGSPYGTLYVNSASGAYTFVPNSDAINALTAPTTDDFVITVSDGNLTTAQTFTINIDGVNDAAVISGVTTGSSTEAGGVANTAPGISATGTMTDKDVDNTPNTFTVVSSKASTGGYGTFSVTAAGLWTYTVDNANSKVQALNVGDTLTDTFTVTTIDGTPQMVTITIHGANDAAIISGDTTGSVTEAAGCKPGIPTATGTLTDTDVDNTPNTFVAIGCPEAGSYGTFTMTAAGVWTYTLDNSKCAVQALNVGDTLTDKFTVTTIDGTPQVVTVTIHGANDPAIICGKTTGCVVEAAGCKPGMPTATGTLTDTDVDNPPNTFTAVCSPKASSGGYGTFTMTAAGVWTYTLDNSNSAVQALNVCDKLTDTFTVTTIDGTPQVVTITIQGANDPAIISGTTTGSVTEPVCKTPEAPKATGTLTDTDVDNPSNMFTAVCAPKCTTHGYGTFTMTAAGVWTYTLDEDNCAVRALKACDTLTDTFTVTTIDGTPQVVTITIHGAGFRNLDSSATATQADPPPTDGASKQDGTASASDASQALHSAASPDSTHDASQTDVVAAGSSSPTTAAKSADDTGQAESKPETISALDANDLANSDHFVFSFVANPVSGARSEQGIAPIQSAADHSELSDPAPSLVDSHLLTALSAEVVFRFRDEIADAKGSGAVALTELLPTPSSVDANTAPTGLLRVQAVEPLAPVHDSADLLNPAVHEASAQTAFHHELMV